MLSLHRHSTTTLQQGTSQQPHIRWPRGNKDKPHPVSASKTLYRHSSVTKTQSHTQLKHLKGFLARDHASLSQQRTGPALWHDQHQAWHHRTYTSLCHSHPPSVLLSVCSLTILETLTGLTFSHLDPQSLLIFDFFLLRFVLLLRVFLSPLSL